MNMNKKNYKTAFSIVEVVVIITIMGLIMSGIILSRGDLFSKSRQSKIDQANLDSPFREISDVAMWFDVAGSDSFKKSEMLDNNPLTIWRNSSKDHFGKNNISSSSSVTAPTYQIDTEDSMALVNFSSAANLSLSNINGYELAQNSQVTIFLVSRFPSQSTTTYPLRWNISGSNQIYFSVPSSTSSNVSFFFGNQSLQANPTSSIVGRWNIFTLAKKSSDNSFKIRINGSSSVFSASNSSQIDGTVQSDFCIGCGAFVGDIREIAVIKRELTDSEIKDVEKYLSRKWDIVIPKN